MKKFLAVTLGAWGVTLVCAAYTHALGYTPHLVWWGVFGVGLQMTAIAGILAYGGDTR